MHTETRFCLHFTKINPTKVGGRVGSTPLLICHHMKNTFIPALMLPYFQSNLYGLILIMLQKPFKAVTPSDAIVVKITYKFIQTCQKMNT